MTPDERIEAMIEAYEACPLVIGDWHGTASKRDAMRAAWAAADVEGMVREAAREAWRARADCESSGGSQFESLEEIVARVMQGAG